MTVPVAADLLGGVFRQQGLMLEAGANALGAITSHAGTAPIGF